MTIVLPGLPGLGDAQTPVVAPNAPLSPQALQAQRDYARALMSGTVTKGNGPQFPVVQSWTQGVSNMVNALIGGGEEYNARQREAQGRNTDAANTDISTKTTMSPPEGQSSEGREKTSDASDSSQPRGYRNNNPLNIESGNFTQGQPGYSGSDGRFARFETMDQGVHAANSLLDSYEKRGLNNVAGIIGRWAPANDGNDVSAYASHVAKQLGVDPNAPLPHEMRQQLIAAMAQHENGRPLPQGGGQAMALQPPGSELASNPGVTAIASALRNDGTQPVQEAANRTLPAPGIRPNPTQPMPNGNGIYVDPGLVQRRPQLTHEQMQGILRSPTLDQATKERYQALYLQQGQPITVPYPGGNVVIDPANPSHQQFIPDLQKGTRKFGDFERPDYNTVTPSPGGGIQVNPGNEVTPPAVAGPRSEAAPAAPASAGTAPVASPGNAVTENAPAAPAGPSAAPVQVASADPAQAFAAAAGAGAPAPGPVATPESALAPAAAIAQEIASKETQPGPDVVPGAKPAAPAAAPAMVAQAFGNNPPPGISPKDWATMTGLQRQKENIAVDQKGKEADIEVNQDARKKNNDLNAKRYVDLQDAGQAAIRSQHNLAVASTMLNDKNFYSGWANGVVENGKRIAAALGIDDNAAQPMEVFRKTMASAIANGLKSAYGGLGQIRNKEIELQEKANGSLATSPAANKALIEISKRNATEMANISEIATEYRLGSEVTDPITGKVLAPANIVNGVQQERVGLDPGYDKIARNYLNSHPTFTPQELSDFNEVIDHASSGKSQETAPKTGAKAEGGGVSVDPKAVEMLRADPSKAAQFDQVFGQGAAAKALGTK